LRRRLVADRVVARGPVRHGRRRCAGHHAQLGRVGIAVDFAHFAGTHGQRLAVQALDLRRTRAHAEPRRILRRTGFDVIVALLLQRDRAARRGDGVGRLAVEGEGLDVEAALVDLQARLAVVEREHVELRAAIEAHARAGDRELAAGVGLRPNRVARGERRVGDRLAPAGLVLVVEGHRAVGEGKTPDARRRIVLGLGGAAGSNEEDSQREGAQRHAAE
jgi:hypothetical protein